MPPCIEIWPYLRWRPNSTDIPRKFQLVTSVWPLWISLLFLWSPSWPIAFSKCQKVTWGLDFVMFKTCNPIQGGESLWSFAAFSTKWRKQEVTQRLLPVFKKAICAANFNSNFCKGLCGERSLSFNIRRRKTNKPKSFMEDSTKVWGFFKC